MEKIEIVIHMATELALTNNTLQYLAPFIRFVEQHHNQFSNDYEHASHVKRHSTGQLEKTLVNLLIVLTSYHCTQYNCSVATQIMVFLGYQSYQLNCRRFRQKVENYLRQKRKEGGPVPPSSRSSISHPKVVLSRFVVV